MAGITLAQAEEHLETWLRAESQIALGQSVSASGRGLTRADLGTVGQRIKYWQGEVNRLSAAAGTGAARVQEIVIRG